MSAKPTIPPHEWESKAPYEKPHGAMEEFIDVHMPPHWVFDDAYIDGPFCAFVVDGVNYGGHATSDGGSTKHKVTFVNLDNKEATK